MAYTRTICITFWTFMAFSFESMQDRDQTSGIKKAMWQNREILGTTPENLKKNLSPITWLWAISQTVTFLGRPVYVFCSMALLHYLCFVIWHCYIICVLFYGIVTLSVFCSTALLHYLCFLKAENVNQFDTHLLMHTFSSKIIY